MKRLGTIIFFIFVLILILVNIESVHAATGKVVIYYNDINQHPVGQKVSYDTCTIGTNYKGSAPSINGYTYMPNESETTTYCDEGDNIIAFVYQTKGNNKEGTVNVSCYDTKGNKLNKCTDGRSGTPGVEYYINPPTLTGYKFVRVEGPNNGKFIEGAVNVKFIYESVGGNLVEEAKPETELVKQEPKKEEPVKASNNNTVTTKKIVTKTNAVASTNNTKKEEVKEENKEIVKKTIKEEKSIERSITVVDHTNNNTSKYIVLGGIISSITLIGFVIKHSLFK